MIKIFPEIDFHPVTPHGEKLTANNILWQGIHTCVEAYSEQTNEAYVADLPVGHAVTFPCTVNRTSKKVFCNTIVKKWLGIPFLHSLEKPNGEQIEIKIEKIKESRNVIILNTIDNYYGHSLLKLFNAERHVDKDYQLGLIVIVQKNLQWLVPEGVAEIWTVDIPFSKANNYYPDLDAKIKKECARFDTIYASYAYSHPTISKIERYSRVLPHSYNEAKFRITFVWRNDRPWISNAYVIEIAKRMNLMGVLLKIQNKKIQKLFEKLRKVLPHADYTIVGMGKKTNFPKWIEDLRVEHFTEETERQQCTIYAESRVTIGVHGSNMLLPSAHSGMTVDLMPKNRWTNFAQDIVFREPNVRLSSFCYRFFPITTSIRILAHVIESQIKEYEFYKLQMTRN